MAGLTHSLAHTRPSLPRALAGGFCAPRPTILTPWNWTEVPLGAGAWAPGWQAAGLVLLPVSRQLVSWACGGVSHTMLPCVPASGLSGEAMGDRWPGAAKTVIFSGDGGLGGSSKAPRPCWWASLGSFQGSLFRNQACVCDL